jgi:AcrR family transcriptional regulator
MPPAATTPVDRGSPRLRHSDRGDNPMVRIIDGSADPTRAPAQGKRLSRREAQALTRARVLEAAAEVFAEKGFRAATIADVADRAGYTIGAVYSNFEGKDSLFTALMEERLRRVEADLTEQFGGSTAASDPGPHGVEQRIQEELDSLEAAEAAVPASWGRLLHEYRAYVADDPGAKADLLALDLRCRDIIARHVERFAASIDLDLPLPATQLVELTNALADGLRSAHADGRASMTSGRGLRLVVESMIETGLHRHGRTG